jgi:molecular chaperone DnaJ
MTTGDLYSLLGVAPNASADDIKAAYRTAARRFHPDVNPHPNATEEFKLVADAYAILTPPSAPPTTGPSRRPARGRC